RAADAWRHHDLVDEVELLDRSEDVAADDLVALLGHGLELPLLLAVQTVGRNTALDEVAHGLHEDRQGPLDAVVHTAQETGSELRHQGVVGVDDLLAGPQPGG